MLAEDYTKLFNKKISLYRFFKEAFLNINYRVLVRYRLQEFFGGRKGKFSFLLSILIRNGTLKKYGAEFGIKSVIGSGLRIHHVNGIVIGEGAIIGENANLYQQVTIGAKEGRYPTIGNNVIIYPGAKVVGGITIGDNVVIGANAFISKNIKDNGVAYGNNIICYPED